jgi:TetR/AcrR family transcriptional regulator, lmrAB and yxaGH operons repressor
MADSTRDRMVDSTIKLLASQGFQGASFSSILADSKAPRGSIYHHFPSGKDELVMAALERAGGRTLAAVDSLGDRRPEEIVSAFVALWRALIVASDFRVGCSLLGVTVSADEPRIIRLAAELFRSWQSHLSEVLASAGVDPVRADPISTLLIAACEGAVVLCRAQRSLAPLDSVEPLLREITNAAKVRPSPRSGR